MRPAYSVLSIITALRAMSRGPAALIRFMVRRSAHRHLARLMR